MALTSTIKMASTHQQNNTKRSIDYNNNDNNNQLKNRITCTPEAHPMQNHLKAAVRFKYQFNASQEDLNEMRKLLIKERQKIEHLRINEPHEQLEPEIYALFDFISGDFERMLVDDWLVTRFLLRGKKAAERAVPEVLHHHHLSDTDSSSNSSDDEDQTVGNRAIHLATLELIRVCAKFRYDYRISEQTSEHEFPLAWLKVNGLFQHLPDRAGNPTVYLRVALHRPKLIESTEARHQFKRYMLYTLEQADQQLFEQPGKALCCIFDMTNVAFENIDLELTSWMIKSFKSCSPKLLCYVLVYNPPWFFATTFKLICNTLLSTSKRLSVKFAQGNEILDYIASDNLPHYIKQSLSR